MCSASMPFLFYCINIKWNCHQVCRLLVMDCLFSLPTNYLMFSPFLSHCNSSQHPLLKLKGYRSWCFKYIILTLFSKLFNCQLLNDKFSISQHLSCLLSFAVVCSYWIVTELDHCNYILSEFLPKSFKLKPWTFFNW